MFPRLSNTFTAPDGSNNFALSGATTNFGWKLAAADIDADGYDEQIAGVPVFPTGSGAVLMRWGRPSIGSPTVDLRNAILANPCEGAIIDGGSCDVSTGYELGVGNIDGSGNNLVIAARRTCGPSEGILYIFKGGSRAAFASMNLMNFGAAHGYKISGLPGVAITLAVADVTGDGLADIIIGNAFADRVDVIPGQAGGFSSTSFAGLSRLTFFGNSRTYFGATVAVANEFAGAGKQLIVGAPQESLYVGAAHVFLSPFSVQQNVSTLQRASFHGSSTNFSYIGAGYTVAVGRFTPGKDSLFVCGRADLVATPETVRYCIMIPPKPSFPLATNLTDLSDSVYLASANNRSSFLTQDDCFGDTAPLVDDVNGDGIPDILLSARCMQRQASTAPLEYSKGAVHIVYGPVSALAPYVNLRSSSDATLMGASFNSFGYSMVAGNFTGTGRELAISEPFMNSGTQSKIYVGLSSPAASGTLPTCNPVSSPVVLSTPTAKSAASRVATPNLELWLTGLMIILWLFSRDIDQSIKEEKPRANIPAHELKTLAAFLDDLLEEMGDFTERNNVGLVQGFIDDQLEVLRNPFVTRGEVRRSVVEVKHLYDDLKEEGFGASPELKARYFQTFGLFKQAARQVERDVALALRLSASM